MADRKAIPEEIQANVIDNSLARCAICYGTGLFTDPVYPKPGFQIAHIDKNASNNREDNLALLCIPCHSLYDSTFRQAKNYRPDNIRRWRDKLYEDVRQNRLPPPMIYLQSVTPSIQNYQQPTDIHINTLRAFLKKAGEITQALCSDGTYLSIAIEYDRLNFIENNFSEWFTNPLRSRKKDFAILQDELVSILKEIANSYSFMGASDEVPTHIIPLYYYNDLGHAIKVPEHYCCNELYNKIEIRDKWILDKLTRLRDLFRELDVMAMD